MTSLRHASGEATAMVDHLAEFVNLELLEGQGGDLTADTPLLELGILDSLSTVSLLSFIDETFGVVVPEDLIVPRHFATLDRIADLVSVLSDNTAVQGEAPDELHQLVRLQEGYGLLSTTVPLSTGGHVHMLKSDGDGPPWLLLPALGSASTSWAPIMRTLSGKQQTYALDLAGFGLSHYGSAPPTYREHCDAALEVFDRLEAHGAVLLGISAGAMLATEIAKRRAKAIRGLVISGFGLIDSPETWWRGLQELSSSPREYMKTAYYRAPKLTPALQRISDSGLARPAYRSFLDDYGLERVRRTFDGVSVPTLFLAGDSDQIIASEAVTAASERIPGSKISWLARCGHLPPVERPEQFLWYVKKFLSSIDAENATA